MHPPLGVPDREAACSEVIKALEACHASGFLNRYMGGCNEAKHALTMCLRQERLDRTARNREAAKIRTARKKEVFAQIDREDEEA